MIFDTSFLIALEREVRNGGIGEVSRFLESLSGETPIHTAVPCVVEFEEGYPAEALPQGRALLRSFVLCEMGEAVARRAARIRRELRLSGSLIGDFDILIAATALEAGMELVTDNARHFQRVSGLRVRSFLS